MRQNFSDIIVYLKKDPSNVLNQLADNGANADNGTNFLQIWSIHSPHYIVF